ncbi:MAG: energy transducer TonB [Ignavibacterium sp.]|nr:MAG: energy transducer TonB [Ignavibacterium sp.]
MPIIKSHKADLRAKYSRNIKLCIIIAVALIIAAFKISPTEDSLNSTFIQTQEIITIEDIINTVQKPKIPDPPAKPKIIETSIDEISEDLILKNIDIFEDAPITHPPLRDLPKVLDEDVIFVWSEVMPEPIGGIAAIQKKVDYTEIAIRTRIEGTVAIEAVIDEEGKVIDATIVRDIGGGLGESALRAVLATKFSPGKQRGKPVKVKVTIPIKFVLK